MSFSDFVNRSGTAEEVLKAIVTALYSKNWKRIRSKMLFSHTRNDVRFLFCEVTPYSFKVKAIRSDKEETYIFNNTVQNINNGVDWINSFITDPISKISQLTKNTATRLASMSQRHSSDEIFHQMSAGFIEKYGKSNNGTLFDSIDLDNNYYDNNVYDLDRIANQASTSPLNDLPQPTLEQKENNDYQTGDIVIAGLPISIENPAGSIRSGVSEDGSVWENTLKHHYGYIQNTMGNDGDEIDVFVKSGLTHFNGKVFIIRQVDKDGKFDEHKLVIGANDEQEAKEIYLSNYSDGWDGFGGIEEISISSLKQKLNHEWNEFDDIVNEFDDIGIDLSTVIVSSENAIQVLNVLLSKLTITERKNEIHDFGQKIGGARKDTVTRITNRISKIANEDGQKLPTWAKRFEILENVVNNKWTVFDKRKKSYFSKGMKPIAEYETKDEAEKAIPILAFKLNHTIVKNNDNKYAIYKVINDRKRVQVVQQEFSSKIDALHYIADNAENILNVKTTYGEIDLPKPTNQIRVGKTYRENDATGEDFMEKFAFRGVEFGNWNKQNERQELLNDAYDGLMDLSSVLEVDPKSLSLGGDLALAFGARGKGLSGASAHYEPTYSVINLTKKNGSGSLAHEWLHAFDHYLGRIDGTASNQWITNDDGTKTLVTSSDDSDYVSTGFSKDSKLSQSLINSWKNLQDTILGKEQEFRVDTDNRIESYDKYINSVNESLVKNLNDVEKLLKMSRPNRSRNKLPATEEQLIAFRKYRDAILNGDLKTTLTFASNAMRGSTGYYSNDSLNAISAILKEVRGTNGFNSQRDAILNRVASNMDSLVYAKNSRDKLANELKNDENQIKKVRVDSDFVASAKLLDRGRGANYWATEVELMARAFQGYIEDKIKDQNGYSPFLNYAPQSSNIETPWGTGFIYPKGEERTKINKAFDQLFEEVRKNEIL